MLLLAIICSDEHPSFYASDDVIGPRTGSLRLHDRCCVYVYAYLLACAHHLVKPCARWDCFYLALSNDPLGR